MFATETISSDTVNALLLYGSVLGILLLVGALLRLKVAFLGRWFIPSSLVAGAIGLALGQYGVGVIPAEVTESWAALPGALIVLVFAPMLMGVRLPNLRESSNLIVPHLLFGYLVTCFMIGLPMLLVGLFLIPAFNVSPAFGTMIEVGWAGGHGTAGGMGQVYDSVGWSEGGTLGLTSATVGLVIGIVVGMVLINWAVRRGHTTVMTDPEQLAANSNQGLLGDDERNPAAMKTVNGDIVDSLALNGTLVAVAILIGWVLQQGLNLIVEGMPLFPLAMIGGLLVQLVVSRTSLEAAMDPGSLRLIQAVSLEILIVSAVASIEVPVVIEYIVPFTILMVVAAVSVLALFFFAGPRMFGEEWFEQALVNFGSQTGVAAVGLMLLRAVDPDLETRAAKGYAMRAPLFSPFVGGGLVTASLPILAVNYGTITVGLIFLFASALILIAAIATGYWFKGGTKRQY